MTREEAIKYLIQPNLTSTEISEEVKKQLEAYNMAVAALKRNCALCDALYEKNLGEE